MFDATDTLFVGLVPSMVYQIHELVVMSLTVNSAALFPVIVGLAT